MCVWGGGGMSGSGEKKDEGPPSDGLHQAMQQSRSLLNSPV